MAIGVCKNSLAVRMSRAESDSAVGQCSMANDATVAQNPLTPAPFDSAPLRSGQALPPGEREHIGASDPHARLAGPPSRGEGAQLPSFYTGRFNGVSH